LNYFCPEQVLASRLLLFENVHFKKNKNKNLRQLEKNVFPVDIFLRFLHASGFGEEVIGNKIFYLSEGKDS